MKHKVVKEQASFEDDILEYKFVFRTGQVLTILSKQKEIETNTKWISVAGWNAENTNEPYKFKTVEVIMYYSRVATVKDTKEDSFNEKI